MNKKKKKKRKQKQKVFENSTNRTAIPDPQVPVISQAIQTAVIQYQAGQLNHADRICRQVLAMDQNNADANHLLGIIAYQTGQNDAAIQRIRKAVRSKPDNHGAHYNLGNVLKSAGHLEEAVASYRKALCIKPDYAEAHNNLGVVLREQGRLRQAADSYKAALAINPSYAEAHNNLGVVCREQGHLEAAIISYQKALAIKPDYIEALNNLGNAFKAQGRLEEAVACYQKVLSIIPDDAETYNNLGILFLEQEHLEAAIASYNNAIAINPNYAEAHSDLGVALIKQGRLKDAITSYRKGLNIKPDNAEVYSNLLLGLNYMSEVSREDIYTESLKWDHQFSRKIRPEEPFYVNHKEKERKLKIGYVSPDFRAHSVAFFFEPLLNAHNKDDVEIFCYSNVATPDHVTERLQAKTDHWRSIAGMSDEVVSEQIRRDGIDILVDLAGHTLNNRLLVFVHKPAPIQVTWLGYPNTTGMSVMDYRFTDEIADPIGESDDFHTEKLIRLGSGFLCYQGNESIPENRNLPCTENGYITFGSFNNLTKITPEVAALWSSILRAVPDSHLILKSKQLADGETRSRYLTLFKNEGIADERIALYGWLLGKHHLNLYNKIDIGLDPFPYNGTTTSCEALWMGVPVITLLGNRHAGRVGASILKHIGLEELIAKNPESYIDIARNLSANMETLASLRKILRTQMIDSPLCDASAFARHVENAYNQMWEKYVDACRGKKALQDAEKT